MIELITQIITGISYIVTGATIIARLTPTHKDEDFLEKIRLIVDKISNLFLPDNKEE